MNGTPKHLILLRHAHAEDGASDRERPLSAKGHREIERAARGLDTLTGSGFRPTLVLTSSARRTLETAAAVERVLAGPLRVEQDETLYLASPGQLLTRLRSLPEVERQVLLVGHNPGLAELAALLAERASAAVLLRARRGLGTAAFAALRVAAHWRDLAPGAAELVEFRQPGDVD